MSDAHPGRRRSRALLAAPRLLLEHIDRYVARAFDSGNPRLRDADPLSELSLGQPSLLAESGKATASRSSVPRRVKPLDHPP
jgi:hypothetical protein